MRLLRNHEVLKTLCICIILSAVFSAAAFVKDSGYGVFTAACCLIFTAVYTLNSVKRYRRISMLASDIDKILHGSSKMSLKEYTEGELSVLQSEIYKMTVRLREQQQRLIDEKVYLADSIADISHQIKTPLTSINLLVSILQNPDISPERRQHGFQELSVFLSRIEWLITALLKISKLDAGTVELKKENISFNELIQKSTEPVLIPMELREQRLEVSAEGRLTADLAWTQEAIANIVKNCMEHTPVGGMIKIRAWENELYSEITISDNGNGIAKEDLPHIFERFYKGKNSDEKSFGIGLALARMIIISQNGTVKAENIPNSGALFTIRFYKMTV